MRLKDCFVTHQIEDKQVMVATGDSTFSGIIYSNKTAAYIVDCLKEEITEEGLIERLYEKYDADREKIAEDVRRILVDLRRIGAINE